MCYVPSPERLPMRCPPGRALPGVAGSVPRHVIQWSLLEPALCDFCRTENRNFHVGQWLDSRAIRQSTLCMGMCSRSQMSMWRSGSGGGLNHVVPLASTELQLPPQKPHHWFAQPLSVRKAIRGRAGREPPDGPDTHPGGVSHAKAPTHCTLRAPPTHVASIAPQGGAHLLIGGLGRGIPGFGWPPGHALQALPCRRPASRSSACAPMIQAGSGHSLSFFAAMLEGDPSRPA
jgi:hypothetical protein